MCVRMTASNHSELVSESGIFNYYLDPESSSG